MYKRITLKQLHFKIFLLVICSVFLIKGPIMAPDSHGYITQAIYRPLLYPLTIKIFAILFKDNFLLALVAFQLIIGHIAIYYLLTTLKQLFDLNNKVIYFLSIFLIIPYFGKVGNYVLTEGLSYPLFLFCCNSLIICLVKKTYKDFLIFIIQLNLLLLIRDQFIFMYIAAIAIFFQQRKKSVLVAITLSIIFTSIADRLYHYYQHDKFIATPFTGLTLLVAPLYLSTIEQSEYVKDPWLKNIFLEMHELMLMKGLTNDNTVGYIDPPYHFYSSYDHILYEVETVVFNKNGIYNLEIIDKHCKKLAFILLKTNWTKYLVHFMRNMIGCLGNYYDACLILSILIFSFARYKQNNSILSFILLISTILLLSNAAIIACSQTPRIRYYFYTYTIWVCILYIGLYNKLLRRSID